MLSVVFIGSTVPSNIGLECFGKRGVKGFYLQVIKFLSDFSDSPFAVRGESEMPNTM